MMSRFLEAYVGESWSTKATVARLLAEAKTGAAELVARGTTPKLAVVRVGGDPASEVYVTKKVQMCLDLGFESQHIHLPENTTQSSLLEAIQNLNHDPTCHGILVQLPLPKHLDSGLVLHTISPAKDVDGFHPENVGRLTLGEAGLFPCTPMGVMALIKDELEDLRGKHAVVVGRSNIVGKPMAQLLLQNHCTVSLIHSRTNQPQTLCAQADIVVAAVGVPGLVKGDWIKKGAYVVDVGINSLTDLEKVQKLVKPGSKKEKAFQKKGRVLYGDVHFDSVLPVAAKVTPVPGGVGPLTIAHLMVNCVTAAKRVSHA